MQATRDRRAKRTSGIFLESLEGRTLLSLAVVHHPIADVGTIHAEARGPRRSPSPVIRGRITGTASEYTPPVSGVTLNTRLVGEGSARGFPGRIQLSGVQNSALNGSTISITNGQATFAVQGAPDGSLLKTSYSGSGRVLRRGQNQSLNISGQIIGGAGVFAGQTGSFSGRVSINARTQMFVLNFQASLNPRIL
ncbi:MAG: hypothetical protein NVSMB9_31980 [Isosphaeraceae bacterium]